jgi:rubrerythrin
MKEKTMKEFGFVDDILDFAIEREEEAAAFYTDLAAKMDRAWMRQVFEDFAGEERGHKQKLLGVKSGKTALFTGQKVMDLKIGDYLVDVEPEQAGQDLDYQQALIVAMKKEKAAFKLYSDLAASTDDENLRNLLLSLAQEEAKHKLRFELEYDEQFLTEN